MPASSTQHAPSPRPARRASSWLESLCCALLVFGGAIGCLRTPDRYAKSTLDVELNPPANFELDGEPFCFAGANNYYLAYKPQPMVDDVLESAKALGFRVMRMWGFIDIGSLDGSVKNVDPWGDGKKDGVYFQYWDPKLGRPAYNEGDDGLKRLDYALAKAGEVGVKIILVLTNNWYDFGGMDQYVKWYGRTAHHEFYTAPEIRQAYKNWVHHLVTRVNTVNGKTYRDDPTIFAWELANEPRCKGTGAGAPGWDLGTIPTWVAEMSGYIKSLDPNHMVSIGDEGFLNGGGEHWAYKANDGVDHEAMTAVPTIDFGTFHMYPEDWGAKLEWGEQWIIDHLRVARRLGKPTILEEYGIKVARSDQGLITGGLEERLHHYKLWNETVFQRGGNSSMVWILSGKCHPADACEGLPVYKDYDRYTVYRGDESASLLADFARRFSTVAPACASNPRGSRAPSPFVRVRRPGDVAEPEVVAFGWGPVDG